MSDIAVQSYEPTHASGLATYTEPLRVHHSPQRGFPEVRGDCR